MWFPLYLEWLIILRSSATYVIFLVALVTVILLKSIWNGGETVVQILLAPSVIITIKQVYDRQVDEWYVVSCVPSVLYYVAYYSLPVAEWLHDNFCPSECKQECNPQELILCATCVISVLEIATKIAQNMKNIKD